MKKAHAELPLFRLPHKDDHAFCLLREELKANKFYKDLEKVGLIETFFKPELCEVILACAGFKTISDELYRFYFSRLDFYTKDLKPDNNSVTKQARLFYNELKAFKP